MGVDSGLPDFRGNQGFWNAYPVYEQLGTDLSKWQRHDTLPRIQASVGVSMDTDPILYNETVPQRFAVLQQLIRKFDSALVCFYIQCRWTLSEGRFLIKKESRRCMLNSPHAVSKTVQTRDLGARRSLDIDMTKCDRKLFPLYKLRGNGSSKHFDVQ